MNCSSARRVTAQSNPPSPTHLQALCKSGRMPDDFRPFALYNIEGVEVDLELLIKDKLVSGALHYICILF